ncbi:MAG: serine--tRNA ligase [Acidobacteria bacterium]|nr:serine--tRNA ligase [Acidobacteriota bacterium]
MLDTAQLRDAFDDTRRGLQTRGAGADAALERLQSLEQVRRELLPRVEALKAERNRDGERIAQAKRTGEDTASVLVESKRRADEIKVLDGQLTTLEEERRLVLLSLPNLPHPDVPQGQTAEANVEVRRWGQPRDFDFEPKPHWDLGVALGIIDFERAARMSGARFAVLLREGARLSRALIAFMLDLHTGTHGYTEVEPPFLVNRTALTGTGNLPKFEQDLFRIDGDWDLFLIPTAEVPLTNLHREETLDDATLPLRYVAYTPCFRSEAGSYGADVRGLIRQHQFDKVELMSFTAPGQSYDELERLTGCAEKVLQLLELPHRTMLLCTGDMGFAAARTYDIEVWLPSQGVYREISSCSNTEAFQARRAGIRCRPSGGGKAAFAHTLNGSGLAVGRTLIAILENYQDADGSVRIPAALVPYMGGVERIGPRA